MTLRCPEIVDINSLDRAARGLEEDIIATSAETIDRRDPSRRTRRPWWTKECHSAALAMRHSSRDERPLLRAVLRTTIRHAKIAWLEETLADY
jgi:hypothetical protein